MCFSNATGEAGFCFRDSDYVYVVAHEAVGPDGEVVLISLFFQDVQVSLLVSFFKEYVLSAISTLDDVVRYSGYDYSCNSSHASNLQLFRPDVNNYLVL